MCSQYASPICPSLRGGLFVLIRLCAGCHSVHPLCRPAPSWGSTRAAVQITGRRKEREAAGTALPWRRRGKVVAREWRTNVPHLRQWCASSLDSTERAPLRTRRRAHAVPHSFIRHRARDGGSAGHTVPGKDNAGRLQNRLANTFKKITYGKMFRKNFSKMLTRVYDRTPECSKK